MSIRNLKSDISLHMRTENYDNDDIKDSICAFVDLMLLETLRVDEIILQQAMALIEVKIPVHEVD